MNIDFDEVRMLRDDYVDALHAENAALFAVSAYLNGGGKDVKELARLQAEVQKAYEETTRAGKAWNERIAQALPKDAQS
jgi:hypothetical protein